MTDYETKARRARRNAALRWNYGANTAMFVLLISGVSLLLTGGWVQTLALSMFVGSGVFCALAAYRIGEVGDE